MTATITRREFVLGGLGGIALTAAAAPSQTKPAPGSIELGVQSYTFRNFDLDAALKRIHEAGLRFAEFYQKHIPPTSSPEQLRQILKLCREYDVTPVGFGVQGFTKDHDANKRLFDFAKTLGVRYLSADPSPDSFDSLEKLCEEYKIAIAIHPHGPTGKGMRHRWWSAETILAAVKDRHPLIGACLDTGHLIRMAQLNVKLDPAQQVRVMGARNFAMHLKDHDNQRRTDVPFGDPSGSLDVLAVFRALREVQFRGVICIEYEANPSDPSPDLKKCITHARAALAQLDA